MQLVNKDATTGLYEVAEMLSQQNRNGWQCIYFNLYDRQQYSHSGLSNNFDLFNIPEVLMKNKGTIYLLDNGDMFIVSNTQSKIIADKLNEYLWSRFSHKAKGSYYPFAIMELSRDWNTFYQLCETRYLKSLAEQEYALSAIENNVFIPAMENEVHAVAK